MNAKKTSVFAASNATRTTDTVRRHLLEVVEHAPPGEMPDLLEVLREAVEAHQQKAEIGRRIKRLREQSPYTQAILAERLHVTVRGYQKWEETGSVSYANLQAIADLHGVPVTYFYADDEQAKSMPQLVRIENALTDIMRRLALIEAHLGVDDGVLAEVAALSLEVPPAAAESAGAPAAPTLRPARGQAPKGARKPRAQSQPRS